MEMYGRHQKEGIASTATILPGDLLDFNANDNLRPYGTAYGENLIPMVAVENPYENDATSSAAIDVAYGSGESVFYITPERGDELYMWLGTGTRCNVSFGNFLTGLGSGQAGDIGLGTRTAIGQGQAHSIGFRALEDKNNSAGTVHVRIKVEVV